MLIYRELIDLGCDEADIELKLLEGISLEEQLANEEALIASMNADLLTNFGDNTVFAI